VLGINSYIFGQIYNGALETVNLTFAVLYILYFLKLIKTNSKKFIFISWLLLVLTTLSSWYYGFYLLIFTFFYTILVLIENKNRRKILFSCLSLLGLYFIVITPFAISLLKNTILAKSINDVYRSQIDFIVDTRDYFIPGKVKLNPNVRHFMKLTYIGFVCLVLSSLAFISKYKKEIIKWLIICCNFFILSLGCHLSFFGHIYFNFYLPSKFLPIINTYRAFAICQIIIAILSGYGVLFLISKLVIKYKRLLIVTITLLIICEVLFVSPAPYPLPESKVDIPSIYYQLAKDSENYAIVEIPFDLYNHFYCGRYMYYQTLHKKYLPFAVSYLPPYENSAEHWNYIKENDFLNLILFELHKIYFISDDKLDNLMESFEKLKRDGFQYILVHNTCLEEDLREKVKKFLLRFCKIKYKDYEQISVYELE
jgi:hypothetical protein